MKGGPLPSPVTRQETSSTDGYHAGTVTPPEQPEPRTPQSSPPRQLSQFKNGLSSPLPDDTQPYSQFLLPAPISYEVQDEEAEGVWGYLIPVTRVREPLVLKVRGACPVSENDTGTKRGTDIVSKEHWRKKEEIYEKRKCADGIPAEGYLLGRHPECDFQINVPTVSNRHCLLFHENKYGDSTAVLEDLSGNGTYVNDAIVGRNKRRELNDGDEISVLDQARFIFRYPRNRDTNGFLQQYRIEGQLGKGHFATVYLATRKTDGASFAVKKFEKRSGPGERSKVEGLQQEIAVLMSVSHPNVLCLKDTFDEVDGVYLVLELAPEGELFNWIVMKQKLSEVETRKIFIQLFQGVKYLVSHPSKAGTHTPRANTPPARTQRRPPRHQARKHPPPRQITHRQTGRLRPRQNHRRRILHHHPLRHALLRRPGDPGARQPAPLHSRRGRLVPGRRPLHLPLRLPALQRRALFPREALQHEPAD